MMRKYFCLALLLISLQAYADSSRDFDFFKSIPKYETITLSGQEISIVIKSNYSVTLSANKNPDSYTSSSLSGFGFVSWDATSERIYLQISGTISGSYYRSEDIYRTEREYNVGSTTANLLFGPGTAKTYTTRKVYDHTERYRASGSNKFSEKVPLSITPDGKYNIEGRTLSVTLSGDVSLTISYQMRDGTNTLRYGNTKTAGSSVADEFGTWQWTKDKSQIYLQSMNIQTNRLTLQRDSADATFRLVFSCEGEQIDGTSYTATKAEDMIQLNVSFDDGTNVTLPFMKQSDNVYTYATYNRFLEEWNWDASSIIDQLKEKQMLIITYKSNGIEYSSIFELEGLETILSYIRK